MLCVGIHIVVISCLLEGTLCCDAEKDMSINITAEATSIVECFTMAVETPWQFSDKELSWVLFFERVTFNLCDRNVWRIFQCNYPLMKRRHQVWRLTDLSLREKKSYHKTENLKHFENALELQRQSMHILDKTIHLIQNVKLLAYEKNETRILNDNCSKQFLDLAKLKNTTTKYAVKYAQLQAHLELFRIKKNMLWYYMPPLVIIVFICGMVANGMLLFIFVRHPETRAGPNALLVNLAISDTFFLVCNIALDYCTKLWGFPLGDTACYLYTFILTLVTGSCVYSMTILSLSRYLAITEKPGKNINVLLRSTPVMLTLVWTLSSIAAIPDTLSINTSEQHRSTCAAANHLLTAVCDLLFISLLPLISITCLYICASRRLMDSARNMPGEAVGQVKVKTARERGAKILPALAVVFAITYLPFYTLWAIITVFRINTDDSPAFHLLFYIAYLLFNLNSTLNPVALYAASSMFKKYFNMYLCLRFVKKQTPKKCQNKKAIPSDPCMNTTRMSA